MFAGAPYTVFCDCTTRLGEIDPFSGVHFSSAVAAKQWYAMEQSIYRNAAFVFPSSQFVHRSLIRDYEVPESRVLSVGSAPNLRAPECVDRDYSNRSIVFVGYEFERKGGLVLLEAFRKVVTVLPDAQLWIAGPPRLDYTLPPRACLLGSLEPEQLSEVYRHASLFVMPSLFEPFGIAFLEAMDHRLPCIGSDRCAIPEIISHGETGLVAPAGNSDALAGGIIYLLQRPELMRRMGAAGHAKVRKTFTWPAVARRIDEKLLEVCAHLRYSP
jgi:glycosyltransferase involved in cell wall biosynthesis